jgi:hypothetical protein
LTHYREGSRGRTIGGAQSKARSPGRQSAQDDLGGFAVVIYGHMYGHLYVHSVRAFGKDGAGSRIRTLFRGNKRDLAEEHGSKVAHNVTKAERDGASARDGGHYTGDGCMPACVHAHLKVDGGNDRRGR